MKNGEKRRKWNNHQRNENNNGEKYWNVMKEEENEKKISMKSYNDIKIAASIIMKINNQHIWK